MSIIDNQILSGLLPIDLMNEKYQNKITTIYGMPSFGKSLYSLILSKYNLKNNIIVYFDTDCSIYQKYVNQFKFDISKFLITQSYSLTDTIGLTKKLIRSNDIDIIIIDTINSTTNDNGYYISNKDLLSLKKFLQFSKTAIFFTAQYRSKIFKNSKTVIDTLLQQSDINILLNKLNYINKGNYKYILEYKYFSSIRKAHSKICIDHEYNIIPEYELLKLCLENNIIKKSGVWIKYSNIVLGNGIFNSTDYLKLNSDLYTELLNLYIDVLNQNNTITKIEPI